MQKPMFQEHDDDEKNTPVGNWPTLVYRCLRQIQGKQPQERSRGLLLHDVRYRVHMHVSTRPYIYTTYNTNVSPVSLCTT